MIKHSAILILLLASSAAPAAESVDVKATMKKNFDALVNLQIYAADPKAFADPKNQEEIQNNLDAISDLKHVFPRKMAEQEPGLAAISSLFGEYL
ncbi:MAG: hypothetical protein HY075_00870, partial [Deltaproteobacteria bacterium]|nr:hypothetical protein [Deltaproteobacteria bacterium]